ncbi:MAG: Rrf2 family transcriptional regulator [Deltaproteobacteria bacterium]|nr:Rrf2 family transcriptional regulator [Deltaproteobacteria bacterium]
MRLSTKGQYAVRAMVSLACHADDKPVTLKDISNWEGISLSYLEQLFVKLRKGRIVRSVRGPGGGYVLAKPASEIRVGEVISVVEEPLNPVACLDADSVVCDRAKNCITQSVWKGLALKIAEFLNSITIEDLSKDVKPIDLKTTAPASRERNLCTGALK